MIIQTKPNHLTYHCDYCNTTVNSWSELPREVLLSPILRLCVHIGELLNLFNSVIKCGLINLFEFKLSNFLVSDEPSFEKAFAKGAY
jgi:hypothetical protein